MHTLTRLVGVVTLLAMLGSCAPVRSGGYVEPTSNTVRAVTEQARTDPPTNLIYVLNESSVSVRVFGVTLSDCRNIRQRCEASPVNITVRPRDRRVVMRVQIDNPLRPMVYSFAFAWQAAPK